MQLKMNRDIEKLVPSKSLQLMVKVKEMKDRGTDIIGLTSGEPDFDTPAKVQYMAIKEMTKGNTHYCDGRGLIELRERIAEKLRTENLINCSTANILITPGSKYAIYMAVQALVNDGDEVIILDPSYLSYEPIVYSAGAIPVHVPLQYDEKYELSEDVLERYVSDRTKLIIVNSPNNPTGRMFSAEEIDVLCCFIKKHNIVAISDEVYEKIVFLDSPKHISLGSCNEIKEQVITINGFSKVAAMTGWRIGYLCTLNAAIYENIYRLSQHSISCVSPFIQLAALMSFDCLDEIKEMCYQYEERGKYFTKALNDIPGIECRMPEGAFYAWTRFDIESFRTDDIFEFLLEKANIVGVPGYAYGEGTENCIRFSFANRLEILKVSAERIKNAVEQINIERRCKNG